MVWEFHRLSECEEKRALVQAFRRTLFRCLIGQSQVILKFGFCGRANDSRATAVCVLGWAQASDPLSSLSFCCGALRCGQVGVKPIRSYSDKMLAEEVKKAIIVIKGGITPFARSAIMELCAQREVPIYSSMLRGGCGTFVGGL